MPNREKGQKDMVIEHFEYPNRKDAFITVQTLEEPYGPGSESVISVGCTLKGVIEDPTWKVHVPLTLAAQVADAIGRRLRWATSETLPVNTGEVKKISEDECSK